MTPPLHPAAKQWYKRAEKAHHHRPHYERFYDADDLPHSKPCDFCGETVALAFLCDTCALCEVLRWEEQNGKDRTCLLTAAAVLNSTGVISPQSHKKVKA